MEIIRKRPRENRRSVSSIFGTDISYQYLTRPPGRQQLDICLVDFEPGGRNRMHAHIHEQILFVTSGRGIVADRNGEHFVEPGDTVVIPAGEPHWHGATSHILRTKGDKAASALPVGFRRSVFTPRRSTEPFR